MGLRPSPLHYTRLLGSGGHAGDPDRLSLGIERSGDLDRLTFELLRLLLIVERICCLAGGVSQNILAGHFYNPAGEILHVGRLLHRLVLTGIGLLLGRGGITFLLGIQTWLNHD